MFKLILFISIFATCPDALFSPEHKNDECKPKNWVILLLLLHLSVHGNQGLQCHRCTGVTDPHYCSLVVHCAADEECHTEKVKGEDSIVFYNTGCQKIQLCQLAANGKRSDLHVCEGCCGTDLCNSELCPAGNRSTTTNISCKDEPYVDCKLADDTHSICTERTLAAVKYCQKYCGYCSADGSTLPPPTGTTVDTCKDSGDIDCKLMNDSLHICAKKNSPPTILYCPNFCGICTPSSGGSTTTSSCRDEPYIDCKLADDTHSICTQRTLAAVKYCQKYCGYCSADGSTLPPPTGTTVDTCKDSGDVDCKQMNDSLHICALKDSPPTILYCPKFCGICTPSGDKVMNSTSQQVTTVPVTTVPVTTVPVTTVPVATVPVTTVPVTMTTQLPTTKAITRQPTVKVTVPGITLAASTGPPPKTLPPIASWAVSLLFFLLSVHGNQGLRCHQCTGVTDPHYCSMVEHCAADEECHTEKVIGEESAVFYNSGCQKIQLCQLAANGKRSDLHVCEGCCGTDLCNSELCPAGNSTSPGIQCYQCDQVDSPQDCHNRVTCADGENCIVQEYATDKMEIKYSLGCETKQRCNLLQNLGKRSTQICNECCDTPGCNRHLCEHGNSTNSSCKDEPDVDCKLADDTQNICAQRTLAAVKYCQKYCGYCSADGSTLPPPTGTTVDTCIDSGDIDCKQMNDSLHICAKKNSPPTILYCPKFCGICTPSSGGMTATPSVVSGSTGSTGCKDSADVDCKKANDTQNICALRTIAATKYCPKFCDYCSADGSTHATLPPPTGVTADPCRDSGDLDCKKMNDSLNICSKPNSPPTLLYCPKFCGLCKPACSDSADVDCKLANDTHNICAQGTLAAKNYCPKFCGYCSADGSTHTPSPSGGSTANPCHDTGDVDCKQMDDNLGICAKKNSPPTQMYCPKYCGLC